MVKTLESGMPTTISMRVNAKNHILPRTMRMVSDGYSTGLLAANADGIYINRC